jgi:hypothetical protein
MLILYWEGLKPNKRYARKPPFIIRPLNNNNAN